MCVSCAKILLVKLDPVKMLPFKHGGVAYLHAVKLYRWIVWELRKRTTWQHVDRLIRICSQVR